MTEKNIPVFVEKGLGSCCYFSESSIWKSSEVEVAFSFLNFDYPVIHTHSDFCELLFVYSGSILNYVNGEVKKLNSGDCCLVHKEDMHMFKFDHSGGKDFIAINFLIRYDYFEKLKKIFGADAPFIFEKSQKMNIFHIPDSICNAVYNETFQLQTPMNEYLRRNEFICKKIIIDLIYQCVISNVYSTPKNKMPDWMKALLENAQKPENFTRKPADLLKEVGYSYSYISREFKKYMGCSFVKYFNSVKFNYAKELLINTDCSIISVAGMLGFNSVSHFNHMFKDVFGFPPSALRKEQ